VPDPAAPPADDAVGPRALARTRRRLIPFLFLLYIVSYLDRINVGFAALQMNAALHFSARVFGLGAGIFFLGYVLFEVPSNLALERFGARRWIARIMISWGIASAAMMFVQGTASFYALRLLLGVAEAGFFPGMILYLTYWFPAAEQARAVAQFMTATAIAGVIGGPVSGALLTLDGLGGLAGWQWLFLIEGLPAVGLGLVVLRYLTDRPEDADWLPPDERAWLSARMREERAERASMHPLTVGSVFASRVVWRLAALYFGLVVGLYGISFWLPQIVRAFSGLGDFKVGVVSAVPYLVAAVGMVWVAAHSDRTRERRWHVAAPALVGMLGFLACAFVSAPVPALLAVSVAAFGIWGAVGPFWTLPTAFLHGTGAAAGIALINSVGNVGGFVGPYLLGWAREATGSFRAGILMLAAGLAGAAVLAITAPRRSAGETVA
jgi:ACS family tartrate transporter-like MFS transporter